MTIMDIKAKIDANVTEVAKAREAQQAIVERVGRDEHGAVKLAAADDNTTWQNAEKVIAAKLQDNQGLRADLEVERHAADTEAEREQAAKDKPAPRGKPEGAGLTGLGETIKAITMAHGENSRKGEITLPLTATRVKANEGERRVRNRPEHMREWQPRDSAGVVLAERMSGDRAHVGDVDVERMAVSTGDVAGGLEVGTLPVQAEMYDAAQLLGAVSVYNTLSGTKLLTRTRGATAGTKGDKTAAQGGGGGAQAGRGIAQIVREGQPITDQDPDYGSDDLDAYKLARKTELNYETIQDLSPGDIEAELRRDMGLGMGLGIDFYLAQGTGAAGASGQPQGLIQTTTIHNGAAGTGAKPTASDLIDVKYLMRNVMSNSALRWATSNINLGEIRKLGFTADQSAPLFQVDMTGEWDGFLDGVPIITSPGFPDWANNSKSIVIGDFRNAMRARLAGPMRLDRSTEVGWVNDQIAWRIIQRFDSVIVDHTAVAVLVVKT